MKIHNVMVLLALLLSSATAFADDSASAATDRAAFASLYPVDEETFVRLEMERRHKFSFEVVRTIVTRRPKQASDRGTGAHLTIIKNLVGAIDTRSVASVDTYQGTSTIQIAIASGSG